MNKEEKDILEKIRKRVEEYEQYDMATFFTIDCRKLFAIIDKQEKEIEELKLITNGYESYCVNNKDVVIVFANKEYFNNGIFKERKLNE